MYGLSSDIVNILIAYFKQIKQIKKVIIFGSRAYGNYKSNSDIDFALSGDIDEHLLFKIADDLNNLPIIYKIDVLNYEDIKNQKIFSDISTNGRTFYERVKS